MLLEQKGYIVTNAVGFTEANEHCSAEGFDLFILGHSIPEKDKLALIKAFRKDCPAPILSLDHHGEDSVPSDFHASPDDPKDFVQIVENILGGPERQKSLRAV